MYVRMIKLLNKQNYWCENILCSYWLIVGRGFLTPSFMKIPLYCLPLFFQILFNPHLPTFTPTAFFVALFLWLNWWSLHICCVILPNDTSDLHMSSLGIIVPEGPYCVFYVIRHQVYWGQTDVFFLQVLWFYITRIKTQHLQGLREWRTH